jgi:hypothetical protein
MKFMNLDFRMKICWSAAALVLLAAGQVEALIAVPADSRVDLKWDAEPEISYNVYRNDTPRGTFEKINKNPHPVGVYSDFIGKNGRIYYYKVSEIRADGKEKYILSKPVSARPQPMNIAELTTSIQEATFRYFWDYAHPVSGLTRERYFGNFDGCASGGTGFGVLAIMIGAERGFVTREAAAERLLMISKFLEKADRYHGAWAHWINGTTGETINFSKTDDGADIVETALLMQGLLTVRQYFDRNNAVEKELRETITRLWETVEWDWFYRDGYMIWHWSPNHGFAKNLRVRGYNECMIVYLLAVASPTHSIPPKAYYEGWAGHDKYENGREHYGITMDVGPHMGGPLFLSHYSFTCFDPRGKKDRFTNYFENAKNITKIQRAYCKDNPGGFKGYNGLVWGLTACYTPDGYRACEPGKRDNGTIAPTAALGSMPYTPEESLASMKHFYYELGEHLWGPFGFCDSFNLDRNWYSDGYLAIDQGPIIVMIENARTGLCWNNFMKNPEIDPMLEAIGFEKDDDK